MAGRVPRVNYDEIAPTYNRRFENQEREAIAEALVRLAEQVQARRILEVGCGTGHWLRMLRPALPPETLLYGLDLSAGMLAEAVAQSAAQAAAQPTARWIRGQAEQLPFPTGSFELVYCVNAIHHFRSGEAFVQSAARLLRPAGALASIAMDPRRPGNAWYIYDFFEGTRETDLARFPRLGTILDWMVAAGFESASWKTAEVIRAHHTGEQVLSDPFLEKNSCSQLALLSEPDYQAGLERIQLALRSAESRGEYLVFENTIHLEMVTGRR